MTYVEWGGKVRTYSSCSIPYFNLFYYSMVDRLALALNSFWWFTHIVPKDLKSSLYDLKPILWVAIWYIEKRRRKKEISNNWFLNRLSNIWTISTIKNCHFLQCNHCFLFIQWKVIIWNIFILGYTRNLFYYTPYFLLKPCDTTKNKIVI